MTELFQQLLLWVSANPYWAGIIVFSMAFAESLAMVGMLVPGVAIMFAIGALIGAGALDFQTMLIWSVLGAVAGDGLSFWLGKKYQRQLTAVWPFSKYPAMLDKGIAFFQRYGGKSVVIGRFFGPVRAVIPLVAGMMNMNGSKFLFANILSALLWAPAYLLPGMAFGASMEMASEVAVRLVVLLVVLVGSLWFLGWLSHRLFLLIQPNSKKLLHGMLGFGERHPWLRNIARALGDPKHPESAGLAMLAGLLVVSSSILVFIALLPQTPLLIADSALHLGLNELKTPSGDLIMLGMSALAGSSSTLAMLILVSMALWVSNMPRSARHWLVGAGSVWLLSIIMEVIARQYPSLLTAIPDIYVLRASVFFTLGAVLITSPIPQSRRWIIYSTATLLIVMVMFAQLYLGSTLISVLHAFIGGLIWSTALGIAYRTHGHQQEVSKRLAWIMGVSILFLTLASSLSIRAPIQPPPMLSIHGSMSLQQWRSNGWEKLPQYRDEILRRHQHPLNLQITASTAEVIQALEQQGWSIAETAQGLSWLKLLANTQDLSQLPLLPHSHGGKMSYRVLTKYAQGQRLVIYLWPSHFLIEETGQPIWLGEVTTQETKQWLGMFSYPASSKNGQLALDELKKDCINTRFQCLEKKHGALVLIQNDNK